MLVPFDLYSAGCLPQGTDHFPFYVPPSFPTYVHHQQQRQVASLSYGKVSPVIRTVTFVCAVSLLFVTAIQGQDAIWLEGEQPATKNVEVKVEAFGRTELLAGGKWLRLQVDQQDVAKILPKEGALLGYQFPTSVGGNYEVWARIGYEGVRSPFEWRIDQGPWQPIKPSDPGIDLTDLATWSPVAWLKLGNAGLAVGKHAFEFRVKAWSKVENGKLAPQGVLFACDAICLSQRPFRPNGKFKPGEDWQNQKDRKAARQVFEFKTGGAGRTPARRNGSKRRWAACGKWRGSTSRRSWTATAQP